MTAPTADELPPEQFAETVLLWVKKHCPHLAPEAHQFTSHVIAEGGPCRAGPGFTTVIWYGVEYVFTATQARAVELLWNAWKRRTPTVRQELLLEAAGSDTGKLSSMFQDHPAWKVMIIDGQTRGTYRLNDRPN